MKVTFYLENPAGTKRNPDGNFTAIFARIRYGGYQLKYYTPEKILPKFWNGKPKEVKEGDGIKYNMQPHRAKVTAKFPEHPEFNKRLDNIETNIKNVIRKYANDNGNTYPAPAVLKPLLDIAIRNGGKVDKITFMQFYDDFISRSEKGLRLVDGKPITHGTIKSYYATKNCIKNFQVHTRKNIDFETLDMSFYNDFTKYLTLTVKQSTNYIGKHIKVIKTVLRDAKIFKIAVNEDFATKEFKTIKEESDTIYLPEYELLQIAELNLTDNHRLDRVRDLFLIGCYTGLRFSDLSALSPEQIENGMITITQIKTGGEVVIPVHDIVIEIMSKYGGLLPKAISNQKTNAALKDLAKLVPALNKKVSSSITKGGVRQTEVSEKWELVTTHTARRSFATNQYLNGIPTLSIMAITGHKTESAFMKYIKVTSKDQANIMAGIWNERKEQQVKRIAI